jgi:D-proline reductase (dithiol) PrdB
MSTILVTNMPFWSEKIGTPRTLAVAFPFGHLLGAPGDADQQRRVIQEALQVLETADKPGTTVHSAEVWPEPLEEAQKNWQPPEPSPIISVMGPKIRELLRERRKK